MSRWRDLVSERVRAAVADRQLASLSLSVVRDGEVLLEEAHGTAGQGRPATVDTPYLLASVTKVLTATGVMTLVDRGAVDLDRPINDYLGVAVETGPYPAEAVTVRRVLSHTAGFSEHIAYWFEDEDGAPPPMAEVVRRYGVVAFPPGERYRYSNLGYGILGHLLESVAGVPLARFMAEAVFAPLGMTSSLVDWTIADRDRVGRGHDDRGQPIPMFRADLPSAGAMWASVRDLSRLAAFHLGRTPLFADDLRRQMQTATAAIRPGVSMGLGWFLFDRGHRLVKHDGRTCGVTTALWLFPDQGLSLALAASSRNQLVWDLAEEIAAGALGALAAAPPPPKPGPPDRAPLLGAWTGHVSTPDRQIDLGLELTPGGETVCRLGAAAPAVVHGEASDGATLTGHISGDLRAADDRRHPPPARLDLDLLLVGAELRGALIVVFPSGDRSGDDLSYPVRLRRA
jgi:CubicO group peptidase (beta-lactamase class C family)